MATITLPVFGLKGQTLESMDIRSISVFPPVLDMGKGARKKWRQVAHDFRFTAVESDAVIEWTEHRDEVRDWTPDYQDPRPLHGIRAKRRARMEKREAAFTSARAQVGGLRIPDEHDPSL